MHFAERGISEPCDTVPSRAKIEQDPSKEQLLARHLVKVNDIVGGGKTQKKKEKKRDVILI
jgi:hypothetical protein